MSEVYTGDPLTGLIVTYTVPNDGDVRDAASVRITLQPLIDSIQSLATGHPVISGAPEFSSAAIAITHGTTMGFHDVSILSLLEGSAMLVGFDCLMNMGGTFNLAPAVGHAGSGILNVQPGSTFQVNSGAVAYVRDGGTLDIEASGGAIQCHGHIHIDSGAVLSIEANGVGQIENNGLLNVLSGGKIQVEDGGVIHVAPSGAINLFGDTSIGGHPAVLKLQGNGQLQIVNSSVVLDAVSSLDWNGAVVAGLALRTGPTLQLGVDAYRGLRTGNLNLTPQTFLAHEYDRVEFDADFWNAHPASADITLADVPHNYSHEIVIFGQSSTASGIGSSVASIRDSNGTLVFVINGASWTYAWAWLIYDGSKSPKWRVIDVGTH